MGFETKEHYTRLVRLDDTRLSYGAEIETTHWLYESSEQPRVVSIFKVCAGPINMHIDITAAQARELAAKLLEHADEFEAHQEWFDAQSKLAE